MNAARGRFDRCEAYLEQLALSDEMRNVLMARVRGMPASNTREAMVNLHRVLADGKVSDENPAYGSIERRLKLAYGPDAESGPRLTVDRPPRLRLVTEPPLNRSSMVPQAWARGWLARLLQPWADKFIVPHAGRHRRADAAAPGEPSEHPDVAASGTIDWHPAGLRRRLVLLALVIAQTIVATEFMSAVLPYHGGQPLETLLLVLFAILFGWVSAGFWTAMAGFLVLLLGRDRYAISRSAAADAPIAEDARTAVVMPICNEDVARVFAGLRATYRSVALTGELRHFDFFVLSDSNNAETRIAEVAAWLSAG